MTRLRIIPTLGSIRLQSLTGGHVNSLYRELEQAGLSVSTRRLTHAVLHRALRDAVRWGRLVRNPADMADPPAAVQTRVTAWTAKELSRFLDQVADDRLFPLWRLAATTGMRRGELLGLTWRHLDIEAPVSVSSSNSSPPVAALRSDELAAERVAALLGA